MSLADSIALRMYVKNYSLNTSCHSGVLEGIGFWHTDSYGSFASTQKHFEMTVHQNSTRKALGSNLIGNFQHISWGGGGGIDWEKEISFLKVFIGINKAFTLI